MLYCDDAKEHLSAALYTFFLDLGIDQKISVVDSQHQNALAENVGWTLLTQVRHDLDISKLSAGFRTDCLRLNLKRRACTPRAV